MRSSPPSAAATTVDCADRSSAAAAATRKSPESSWVTRVGDVFKINTVSEISLIEFIVNQSSSLTVIHLFLTSPVFSGLLSDSVSVCPGDLRACTYCRKIALNYAHSADSGSIGEDLSALSDSPCSVCVLEPSEPRTPVGGRKSSRNIFLEEDLTWQR